MRLSRAATGVSCLVACLLVVSSPPSLGRVTEDGPAAALDTGIRVAPADGYCVLDAADQGLKTGFATGVARATVLVAMHAPCGALEAARTGKATWLPEWLAYEVNSFEIDEADRAAGLATVAQLCRDARTGHPSPIASDFSAMVDIAHGRLNESAPVVYFGVVAEEPGACFLATLKRETSPKGDEARVLTVTAFMVAGRRWVYQSLRRLSASAASADSVLAMSRAEAHRFIESNR